MLLLPLLIGLTITMPGCFPFSSNAVFDECGQDHNISRLLKKNSFEFEPKDMRATRSSISVLSTHNCYGFYFAVLPSSGSHVALFYGR